MADIKKITKKNHLPAKGNDRFPVYAKQFNEAVDEIESRLDDLEDGAIALTSLTLSDGTVSALPLAFGADENNGLYGVSDTQLGVAVEGTLVAGFDTNGIFTGTISEQVATVGVTIDNALIKDGTFIGKQATATATAAGLTTGALTGSDQFVTVTSGSANDVICLPGESEVSIGTTIRGWVGANGFELRNKAGDATATINGVTGGATNEAAIPATTFFTVVHVATNTWILTAVDELGAVITAIIPDAI